MPIALIAKAAAARCVTMNSFYSGHRDHQYFEVSTCIVVAALTGFAMFVVPAIANAQMAVPRYIIDPLETHSRFEARFLGFMTVRGKFGRTTGNLIHDPTHTDAQSRSNDVITAVIDATTLYTNVVNANATNKVLRGPDFFDVEKFPVIEFKSSRFVWESERLMSIDGLLTLLGKTKPVTLAVYKSGCVPANVTKRARCTADAVLNIKRSDFGMKAWSASVSDDVKIIIELVAYAESAVSDPDSNDEKKPDELVVPTSPTGTPSVPGNAPLKWGAVFSFKSLGGK